MAKATTKKVSTNKVSSAKKKDLIEPKAYQFLKEYINNRMDAVKLNTAEKSSKLLATVIASVVVAMFFITFLFFASTALAFVFSRLTGALSWGFLIVGGIYLLLGVLVWLLKDRILQLPIMNALLRQLFTDEDDYEDE